MLNRADVLGALAEYAASQAALQLEIAKQYPDLHLGPGYQMDQTDSKWTLAFPLTLPLFNRNKGAIGEATARRTEAATRFVAVQARAIGEVELALASYRAALQKVSTTDAIMADLTKQDQAARRMFEAGDISRLELGSVQLELYTGALARLDARIKTQQALGGLEDAMQTSSELRPGWRRCPSETPEPSKNEIEVTHEQTPNLHCPGRHRGGCRGRRRVLAGGSP